MDFKSFMIKITYINSQKSILPMFHKHDLRCFMILISLFFSKFQVSLPSDSQSRRTIIKLIVMASLIFGLYHMGNPFFAHDFKVITFSFHLSILPLILNNIKD